MRIAITGSHSCGKTTLAKLLSKETGLPFMRGDKMKDLMEEMFHGKSFDDLTEDENWQIETVGLDKRIEAENREDSFISDGCSLNSIAYIKAKIKDAESRPDFKKVRELAKVNAEKYNFIFYLPPEIPLEDDGFRPLSSEFRLKIDGLLRKILKDYKFYTIRGTLEERCNQIKEIIEAPGH